MLRGRLRSALERVSLVRLLVGLGLVLVAINIGSAVWDAYSDRARVFRDVERDVSNITSLLVEQTAAGLEAVDFVLRDVQRIGTAAAVARAQPRLREQSAQAPQIAALLIFDQHGRIVARTNETPVIDTSTRRRPFVDVHAQGKSMGLYVSEPYVGGEALGRPSWRFVLSRRLSGPADSYAGVAAAIVEVETYDRLYRSIDLGEGGFIGLFNADGTVITRVPDPHEVRGTKIAAADFMDTVRREGRFDGRVMSEVLKEPVLMSIARVRGGFPLFVATGKTEHAA